MSRKILEIDLRFSPEIGCGDAAAIISDLESDDEKRRGQGKEGAESKISVSKRRPASVRPHWLRNPQVYRPLSNFPS